MTIQKYLLIASIVSFVLLAFGAGHLPWLAIGLALFAASHF